MSILSDACALDLGICGLVRDVVPPLVPSDMRHATTMPRQEVADRRFRASEVTDENVESALVVQLAVSEATLAAARVGPAVEEHRRWPALM